MHRASGVRRAGGRETSSLAVHAAVPPVLNCIVAAVSKASCNLGPALAHFVDHPLDHQALLSRDGLTVQRGLEVLVEALPALLGRAVVHVLRDADPVVGALFANQLKEQLVLFGNPGSTTMSGSHCK